MSFSSLPNKKNKGFKKRMIETIGNGTMVASSNVGGSNSVLLAAMGLTDLGNPAIISPPERPVPSVAKFIHSNTTMHGSTQTHTNHASSRNQHPSIEHSSSFFNREKYQSEPSLSMNGNSFPARLFELVSNEQHTDIISWLPHGRGFMIHDKTRFAKTILPVYFDGTKFTSFTRRLKRWSFTRIARGPELGAYYNKNFVRGYPGNVKKMRYRITLEKRALAAAKKHAAGQSDNVEENRENDDVKETEQEQQNAKIVSRAPTIASRSLSTHSESYSSQFKVDDNIMLKTPCRSHGGSRRVSHAMSDFQLERQFCPPPSRQHSFYETSNSLSSFQSSPNFSEQRLLDIEARLMMLRNIPPPQVAPPSCFRNSNRMMATMQAELPLCNNPSGFPAQQGRSLSHILGSSRSEKHKLVIDAAVRDLRSRMGNMSVFLPNNTTTNGFETSSRLHSDMKGGDNSIQYMERMKNSYRASAA